MAKTTATTTPEKPATLSKVMDEAATKGVEAFASQFTRFRSSPPAITSKRAAPSTLDGVNELVVSLRTATIGNANNGRVDVDEACDLATKAIAVAVKASDAKGIPVPFAELIDAETLQRMAIPVLRMALVAWNNQLPKPEPKPSTL